jgi:hypothetical protein
MPCRLIGVVFTIEDNLIAGDFKRAVVTEQNSAFLLEGAQLHDGIFINRHGIADNSLWAQPS